MSGVVQFAAESASRAQAPVAEFVDDSGFFRNRNKMQWRYHSPFGAAPAHQRFHTDEPAGLGVDLRLVTHMELFLGLNSRSQAVFQRDFFQHRILHGLFKKAICGATGCFGHMQSGICFAQQIVETSAVFGEERDADAG